MNVAASTLAHFGYSGLAVFAENGPTLAIVDRDRQGEALGGAYACQMYFLTNCEAIDED